MVLSYWAALGTTSFLTKILMACCKSLNSSGRSKLRVAAVEEALRPRATAERDNREEVSIVEPKLQYKGIPEQVQLNKIKVTLCY